MSGPFSTTTHASRVIEIDMKGRCGDSTRALARTWTVEIHIVKRQIASCVIFAGEGRSIIGRMKGVIVGARCVQIQRVEIII